MDFSWEFLNIAILFEGHLVDLLDNCFGWRHEWSF